LVQFRFLKTANDRLKSGIQGTYPEYLIEHSKDHSEIKHPINETLTRPWIKHYFIMEQLQESLTEEEKLIRNKNLLEIFKTSIPLAVNSYIESDLSSWRMFLDNALRDADTPWYPGIKKIINHEKFFNAIEHLELEISESNPQRDLKFYDHKKTLKKIPRIPIKLFFSLQGNEREKIIQILQQSVNNNPHNIDVALLTYCFLKAWDRARDFLEIVRTENRNELEEWYFWVENDLPSVGALKRDIRDYVTSFYIYDRAALSAKEYKELADWYLKESEFKSAYHFYYKAKEFEFALELLQNISVKEFGELTNLRRISKGEKPFDLTGDTSRISSMYQEEMETLKGFVRIRAAEAYKEVAVKARQHFDRETIETKYAFGELSEDEYQRLIKQLQERKQ
jgi:hypothetical protein